MEAAEGEVASNFAVSAKAVGAEEAWALKDLFAVGEATEEEAVASEYHPASFASLASPEAMEEGVASWEEQEYPPQH